jgi:hypothetical protein
MATQHSNAGKHIKSVEATKPAAPSAEDFVDVSAVEAPAVAAPSVEPPLAEAAPQTIVPVTVFASDDVEAFVADFDFDFDFEFDPGAWSKKIFDLWSENAYALVDFAEGLAKAKTFEDIVTLQSRFANEQVEGFVRQSKELMAFGRRSAGAAAGPICYSAAAAD